MSSFDATQVDPELPPVDARLVRPGTRYEMHDGVLVHVPPTKEPHGSRHSKISALVELHVAPAFDVASDMLTRTSKTSDVAPDVSVFPRARDPRTGGRQIEQLAFEVVSTSSLKAAGDKARKLAGRGVRRLFAIDVARARALEWSVSLDTWSLLDPSTCIEDPALAAPLSVEALVRAASAHDAAARALLIMQNPVIEEARASDRAESLARGEAKGLAEGMLRGKTQALLAILAARGIASNHADRARILDERDPARLDRWIARATICAEIAELFAEP